jgi:hypothetical protein
MPRLHLDVGSQHNNGFALPLPVANLDSTNLGEVKRQGVSVLQSVTARIHDFDGKTLKENRLRNTIREADSVTRKFAKRSALRRSGLLT